MSEDPSTLTVEADIPPEEAEEVLKTKTDDEVLDHALAALFDFETKKGGSKEKRKRGAPEPEPEEENFLDRARRLQRAREEAEREAREAGDGAGDVTMSGPAGAGAGSAVPAPPEDAGPARQRQRTTAPLEAPTPEAAAAVEERKAALFPRSKAAAKGLIGKFETVSADVASAMDTAGAWLFENLPGFLKAGATGAATKAVFDNPYMVSQIADTVIDVATAGVQRLGVGADWDQYVMAINRIAASMGTFGAAVRDAATAGPGFGISVALLILRYRAHHGGAGSITGQILADAKAVANLATSIMSAAVGAGAGAAPTAQEAVSMASEYLFAALVEAGARARAGVAGALGTARAEATVSAMRTAAQQTQRGKPTGEGAVEMTKAVGSVGPLAAAPGPVPGTIAVASGKPLPKLSTAVDKLAKIPQGEKSVLKELLTGAGSAVTGFGKGVYGRLSGAFGRGEGAGAGSGVAPSTVPLPRTGTGPVPVPSSLSVSAPRRGIAQAAPTPRPSGAGAGDVTMTVPGAAAPMDESETPKEGESTSTTPKSESGDVAMGATPKSESGDVAMKKGGRRRKTRGRRKTYRKKGKKTRGKTQGRRAFIY